MMLKALFVFCVLTVCQTAIVLAVASVQQTGGELTLSAPDSGSTVTQVEFFVSPRGNDTWSGRGREPDGANGPFATLERARDAVRVLRQTRGPQVPVRETIRSGTYYLGRPVVFGPEDSGAERAPVINAAAAGEKAALSGGRPLVGGHWGEANSRRAWVVDVSDWRPNSALGQ